MKNAKLLMLFVIAGFSLLCARPVRAANHVVQMYFFKPPSTFYVYIPATLTVAKGDTVTWTNADQFVYSHTTTSGASPPTPSGLWDSGTLNNAQTYTLDTSSFNAGTYPYFCKIDYNTSPAMVGTLIITNPPNVAPTVSITNPIAGAKFLAPANITLKTSASDTDGSVTNVQFFSGATSMGNVTAAPFNFTTNNLGAGNYSFTAKAFDNLGATTTSVAVNIFVQTNATITSSALLPGGSFQFTLNGIAGQTYAIEASSNLLDWSALFTNVAPADVFNVTDATSTNALRRFYRTRQDF
jgi:plastocyanin